MTNVFVSYSRTDKARVEPLVAFIDEIVGEVWWDDRLVSGESFTEETERRLNEADFVVVVWTPTSARSKWVLDEAAVGRDAGKLLPVSLDGQIPPLGFRHVHTTDFSAWNGTPDDKCARALKAALLRARTDRAAEAPTSPVYGGGVSGEAADGGGALHRQVQDSRPRPPPPASRSPSPLRGRGTDHPHKRRSTVIIGALAIGGAVALVLAIVAALQFAPKDLAGPAPGSIAVLPFADLSAAKDRAYFAEGIAEEILSALARDPALKVIGRTSSVKFAGTAADIGDIRRALNVEHVLEGSVRAAAGRVKINVSLLRTKDGVRVWSEQYDRPEADIFAIENEVGAAVAERLGSGGVPAARDAATNSIEALDLLLEAREKIRKRTFEDASEAKEILERALALDPASAAIHGALAEAVFFTAGGGFLPAPSGDARALAEKAIALDPNRADGYAALALIVSDQPALQKPILEKAIALDPSRSDLRMWLGAHESDPEKRLENLREIIAFDPLWQVPVRNLASRLVALGRYEEAKQAIDAYEARAPDDRINPPTFRAEIAEAKGELAAAYGELAKIEPQTEETKFQRARYLSILGMDAQARALVPESKIPPDAWARRDSDAIFRLTYAIPKFTTSFPYELLADHRRPGDILTLYDERLGETDAWCERLDEFGVSRGAPSLVWAMKEAGRNEEAQKIAACTARWLENLIAEGREKGYAHLYLAQLDALDGRGRSAVAHLRAALREKFGELRYSADLREYRAFDGLQASPDFQAVQKLFDAEAARHRAEIARIDREAKKSAKAGG